MVMNKREPFKTEIVGSLTEQRFCAYCPEKLENGDILYLADDGKICFACAHKNFGPICECGDPVDISHDLCEECCEHGDMDDAQCMDCGADRTEYLSAMAYDRAKDQRKYGDIP